MGFVSRGGGEVVRWGDGARARGMGEEGSRGPGEEGSGGMGEEEGEEGRWKGGLAAGEEVLNHYCDIELDVRARREWAVGALGGWCLCGRCVWEAGEGG